MAEKKMTERQWEDRKLLRDHWNAFCDADIIPIDRDTFTDRMQAAGFISFRSVKKADLNESFAAERGIEIGGTLWELTKKGHAVLLDSREPNEMPERANG